MVGGHFAKLVQCVYVGPAAVQSNGDIAVNLGRVILVLPFTGRKNGRAGGLGATGYCDYDIADHVRAFIASSADLTDHLTAVIHGDCNTTCYGGISGSAAPDGFL